jgi:uncharacterized protein YegL
MTTFPATGYPASDPTHSAAMPGGGIAKRPMHFIIAADASGSMIDSRIQSLNFAIATVLPQLAKWERMQDNVRLLIRIVVFGNEAVWHIEEPTPVSEVRFQPIKVIPRSKTRTGAALRLIASVLTEERLERRALRPAILLITDGIATDDFNAGLSALLATPGGERALRIAVAIGEHARVEDLVAFSDSAIPVLRTDRTEDIPDLLKAVTFTVSKMSEVGVDRNAIANQLRNQIDQSFV